MMNTPNSNHQKQFLQQEFGGIVNGGMNIVGSSYGGHNMYYGGGSHGDGNASDSVISNRSSNKS
eukprot:CAMPEP_0194441236 /NCGR_PEP_ID=MMETSP0176-20130528/120504_1 /TAXON_ID=216777 /ORGANISM="Proboscia alata, Strain PI-D3" /LENGTH=63 /DNA_ID=CAMNT_0039266371 /DNA_START=58 /DNA_END=245 /DNA_ORIENTATION=+